MRKHWCLAAVCAILSVGCRAADPPAAPFKTVVGTRDLMTTVIDPSADIVWNAVKTIVTTAGVNDVRPTSDDEWAAVRNAAITVAESGNLLMLGPRAKDDGEWMRASQALIETGTAAMRAAEAKNADELFTVGGDMYSACLNCHQKYMAE